MCLAFQAQISLVAHVDSDAENLAAGERARILVFLADVVEECYAFSVFERAFKVLPMSPVQIVT